MPLWAADNLVYIPAEIVGNEIGTHALRRVIADDCYSPIGLMGGMEGLACAIGGTRGFNCPNFCLGEFILDHPREIPIHLMH